jgi:HlyD family secretion protein
MLDAFPGEEFHGQVNKIRLNASMVQNVVSYIVEVDTENPQGRLLPYLTATVRFQAGEASQVLLVPVVATRFVPRLALYPELNKLPTGGHFLWELTSGGVRPIPVTLGVSDGNKVVVSGDMVREGMEVIVGERAAKREQSSQQGQNPFMPQPFGGKRS